jgi:NADH:ubiquinone oxidoreductase subunit 3 (subunit A)
MVLKRETYTNNLSKQSGLGRPHLLSLQFASMFLLNVLLYPLVDTCIGQLMPLAIKPNFMAQFGFTVTLLYLRCNVIS